MKGWIICDEDKEFTPAVSIQTPGGKVPIFFDSKEEAQQYMKDKNINGIITYGGC